MGSLQRALTKFTRSPNPWSKAWSIRKIDLETSGVRWAKLRTSLEDVCLGGIKNSARGPRNVIGTDAKRGWASQEALKEVGLVCGF